MGRHVWTCKFCGASRPCKEVLTFLRYDIFHTSKVNSIVKTYPLFVYLRNGYNMLDDSNRRWRLQRRSIFYASNSNNSFRVCSACPEKITEYEERKAQQKKKKNCKPRERRKEKVVSHAEINAKLQNLLLDDELGSRPVSDIACNSEALILKDKPSTVDIDTITQDLVISREFRSRDRVENVPVRSFRSDCSKEVIDLLSPSPPRRNKNVSKNGQDEQIIEVINLSDSETEVSPECRRKDEKSIPRQHWVWSPL